MAWRRMANRTFFRALVRVGRTGPTGQVVEGLEVVAKLAALECDGDDRPTQAVVISDCGVVVVA